MTNKGIEVTTDIGVKLLMQAGGDRAIVAAAKVEEFVPEEEEEGNTGLINSLMRHKHGSPFEHGMMSFFVDAPIFVWREHHRHRIGWSYNEESARYRQLEPKFWVPKVDRPMAKVVNFKPMRPKMQVVDVEAAREIFYSKTRAYMQAYEAYLYEIDRGIAPEVARSVLPVAIYSKGWTTCNPRSIMKFLELRTHDKEAKTVSYPQAEIEDVARQYEAVFATYWPVTYLAFVKHGRVAP